MYRPSHTLRCCLPAMGRSKALQYIKITCDVRDAFSNMLEVLLPILEYISYLLSDFQTVCSIVISIQYTFMGYVTQSYQLEISNYHCCDENRRRIGKHSIVGSRLATPLPFLGR